ncbi:hypothetical protein [Clostridium novyi]|uniref:hypothetical protein n=1 Tax=Clostridium novyi TaxID=1542 RepID=UPI0004D7D0C3|nr:hypothetical protein [Clostridium novyi]KEI08020.1 hypothetical protein Z958_p0095 [Clostridium novyi B str. NCTC 9691]KEI12754.1 hypothetical protein Z958_05595 [Clostridium novyi B str. NCTC 9691]
MKSLKIVNLDGIARVEVEIRENEKVIIKGERAFIVDRNYTDIENIEEDLSIEAPYQLENFRESFIIE